MKKIKINETLLAVIISIAVLFLFIFIFTNNQNNNTKQDSATYITLEDLYTEEDDDENIKSTFTPIEIVWTGKIHWRLTYGRILLKNLNPDAEYKYFIAEPDDVIPDGGRRYSPTTESINETDVVKITAFIKHEKDYCSWDFGVDDTDYRGCVPWVFIDKIEVIE